MESLFCIFNKINKHIIEHKYQIKNLRVIFMNFIACTDSCIYQKDGVCTLECAASLGELRSDEQNDCIHFIEKNSKA